MTAPAATTKRGLVRKRVGHNAPLDERIILHTDRSGDCWLWTGFTDKVSGYGRITVGDSLHYAHRISYMAFVGDIAKGMQIDHLCRVRACCNPFHLEAVTAQVNVIRGESPGARALRRELCLHGHAYVDHGVVRNGRRVCRLCRKVYMSIYNRMDYAEVMRRKHSGVPVVDLAAHFAAERRRASAA